MSAKTKAEERPDAAAFEGRLSSISLFDVCQFLMLNRKTGTLTARNGPKAAYLTFHEGQMLNAVDEALKEGEPVILEAVQWAQGTFSFVAGPVPPDRRIQVSTENILLEAARQLDEMRAGNLEDDGEPTHTETLRKSQEWTATLGEAFRDAVQSDDEGGVTRNWRESVRKSLEDGSAERAILGPGSRIRLIGPTGIRTMEAPAASEVESWANDLLPADDASQTFRRVSADGAGHFWVQRVGGPGGGTLAVTRPPTTAPTWKELGLGADLAAALGRHDTRPLIVTSTNAQVVRWALAGWIAHLSGERPLVGWVLEPWPSFDWSALPGHVATLLPEDCSRPGDLTRACEAIGCGLLVLRGISDGALVREAFALSSTVLHVVVSVTAAGATETLRQLEDHFGRSANPSDFAARVRGIWSIESATETLVPFKSSLASRRDAPR